MRVLTCACLFTFLTLSTFASAGGDHPFPFGDHPFPVGDHPFPLTRPAYVTSVIDGDTVTVEFAEEPNPEHDSVRVDLEGIDALEMNYRGWHQGTGAFLARQELLDLIPIGAALTLAFETDEPEPEHGAVRAHLFYFHKAKKQWLSVNEKMLIEGWALSHAVYPHILKAAEYRELTLDAMRMRRGMFRPDLWRESPYSFRARIDGYVSYWVGDVTTRWLIYPTEFARVPIANRVYFLDPRDARRLGYRHL